MVSGCVFGCVRSGVNQLQMHLQRRVAKQTAELGLCDNLGRHQVQQQDLQRTDILTNGPGLAHDKNVLLLQNAGSGQIIGNLNGHGVPPGCVSVLYNIS